MVKIYELVDEDGGCLYVGHTINVGQRRRDHENRSPSGCGSRNIPDDIRWKMNIIEECAYDDRLKREAYWIHLKNPLYNIQKLEKYRKEKCSKKPPIWIQENGRMIINPDRNSRQAP
jgi:hypothetical protein